MMTPSHIAHSEYDVAATAARHLHKAATEHQLVSRIAFARRSALAAACAAKEADLADLQAAAMDLVDQLDAIRL